MEKRLGRRIEFRKTIAFELSAASTAQLDDSPLHEGRGIDLSSHGLGMETEVDLEKGEMVKLLVPLGGSGINLPVFAEVQWVKPAEDRFRAGLRFLM